MTCWCSLAENIVIELYFLINPSSIKTRNCPSSKIGEISGKNFENTLYAHIILCC